MRASTAGNCGLSPRCPAVVAEPADGVQTVELAARHRPDIALVDIQMPTLDGIEATRRIVEDERSSVCGS